MSASIVASARSCIGAPFRPQGRDAASGLDCVGVVALAYGARLRVSVPGAYAQRGGSVDAVRAWAIEAGLRSIDLATAAAGDLLLLTTGPAQLHLAVLTDGGFVHADARLRRVIETPGPPPWPVAGAWTLNKEE